MAGKKFVGEVRPFAYDPSPEYACDIRKDGSVSNFMSFDPRSGPESQDQIDYFIRQGNEAAKNWRVGMPIRVKKVDD